MRRLLSRFLIVAFILGLAVSPVPAPVAEAQTGCVGLNTDLTPMGFETITVSTTAIGFSTSKTTVTTTTNVEQAIAAVVSVETANVRYRDDGTSPTSSVGHPVTAPAQMLVCGRDAVLAIKFIRSGGADATASVSYYKRKR